MICFSGPLLSFNCINCQLKCEQVTFLQSFSLIFFQSYYVRSLDSSLPQFFVPQVLDTLLQDLNAANEVINEVDPNLPKWLGETANASGGGAKGISDRFVAGFM